MGKKRYGKDGIVSVIASYNGIAPKGDLMLLQKLAERLHNRTFLHINSTKEGGGVAEILQRMIPIFRSLDIDARWEVITGNAKFFDITKKIHNALQGNMEIFTDEMWEYHFEVNKKNADAIDLDADAVIIHDPQPGPLVAFRKRGTWLWRCHIDLSNPIKDVYTRLGRYAESFDAVIFSVARFARALDVDEFIIPPSIDPLSEKNRDLTEGEIKETAEKLHLSLDRPIILQVSRFDRFKDPTGVIEAYRMVKRYNDCVLVLAGSPAIDDPEGAAVLAQVEEFASSDPDIHILLLPPFSDKDINALQRMATIVLQKSLKEGFGLTVSEAMWKKKPVIGGAVGGIPLQIVHGVNGFLVNSIEGTAFRMRQLLNQPGLAQMMGNRAKERVRENFLITRQARDYLAAWYATENRGVSVFEL